MRAIAVLTAVLACSGSLSAQGPARVNPIDSSALAAFADEFFPQNMARRQIPGLVFVFVSGGEIAIARGFGVAQLEPRRPVDPDRTVFGLASVSKTITATAALQLVERKRLDLDTNVNTYLKSFQLAAEHGPITLHHLLTHTAGFDERLIGAAARSADDLQPSSRYLARSMPPTFIEPGRVISYSNHGYALIGHLVEEVSGRPFADYVRDEIFDPLGMRRSGALTGRAPDDLAVAYEYVDGQYRGLAPDYLYVRRARTTMEKMIGAVNRVRITRGASGTLTLIGSSAVPVALTPIGPTLFLRGDGHGVVTFDAVSASTAGRLVAVTDSGFPSVVRTYSPDRDVACSTRVAAGNGAGVSLRSRLAANRRAVS